MKILFLLLILPFAAAFQINEISYTSDPEWIEISLNETFDFNGLEFRDAKETDQISCCIQNCSLMHDAGLILITENDADPGQFNDTDVYCVDDSRIGNSLNNGGDDLTFFKDNMTIAQFSYSKDIDKGKTLSYFDDGWAETNPTPGKPNLKPETNNGIIIEMLDQPFFTGIEYTSFFKITNLDHIAGTDDNIFVKVNYNVTGPQFHSGEFNVSVNYYTTANTGNFMFSLPGAYTLCGATLDMEVCENIDVLDPGLVDCDVDLWIESDKEMYENYEQMDIKIQLTNTSFPFNVKYWIDDLFNESVKSKIITSNTNTKHFTPGISEIDRVFVIKAVLDFIACNNSQNASDEKLVYVKGEKRSESKIQIERVYLGSDDKAVFGDTVRVKIIVYKGNTTKNSISMYVTDGDNRLSTTTSFNLHDNFRESELTMPVKLDSYCSKPAGTYKLVVEGLDTLDSTGFFIESASCSSQGSTKKTTPGKDVSYDLVELNPDPGRIKAKLLIENNDASGHEFDVWSYLYRGSKSYSGERESNMKNVKLKSGESKTVLLENFPEQIDADEFKFKIKIIKDKQKTPSEITETIKFILPPAILNFSVKENGDSAIIQAHVNSCDGCMLELVSSSEEKNIPLDAKVFSTPLLPGMNRISLRLYQNDQIIDIRDEKIILPEIKDETNSILLLKGGKQIDETLPGLSPVTGAVPLYVSSTKKAQNLTPFFVFISVILVIIGLIKLRK